MTQETALVNLVPYVVGAGLGAVIGMERQYSTTQNHQGDAAGVRTHALWGVVGVAAAHLSNRPGWEYLYLVGLVAAGLLLGISHVLKYITTQEREITTELSQLAVFLIAALVEQGDYVTAVPLAVGVTVLLRARESLYNLSERFGAREMSATIRFAVIAGAVLPFLPNQAIGPLDAFNPQKIWIMVVLVAGISFSGYMLVLFWSHKGLEITGFLSGFVSSTAASLQLSRQSRETSAPFPHVCAVLLACSVAFPRTLLLVGLAGPKELLQLLAVPLLATTGVGVVMVWAIRKLGPKSELDADALHLENPLRLSSIASFGVLYVVVVFLTTWAHESFAPQGVLVFAAISGISGASAITLSVCELAQAHPSSDLEVLARAILLATVVTTALKAILVTCIGAPRYRLWTSASLLILTSILGLGAWGLFWW